jgi:hypothetical protein
LFPLVSAHFRSFHSFRWLSKALGTAISAPLPQQLQPQKKRTKKAPEDMDPAKAELLVEEICLNAARNRRWQNVPLDETDLDCISAKRPLPCSLCAKRANVSIMFPPRDLSFPLFLIASPASKRKPISRATKLKKKERPIVETGLSAFGMQVFEAEMFNNSHQHRVKSWFFPPSLQDKLADSILQLATPNDLDVLLKQEDWYFHMHAHQANLWDTIKSLQVTVTRARAQSGKKGG